MLEPITFDFLSFEYCFCGLIQISKLFRKNLSKIIQKCNRIFVTDFRAKSVVKMLVGRKIWYQITTALGALRVLLVPLPLPPLERVPEPKQTAEKPTKPKKRKNKKATTKPQKKKRKTDNDDKGLFKIFKAKPK